jgi:small subunit ribosomal protein S5
MGNFPVNSNKDTMGNKTVPGQPAYGGRRFGPEVEKEFEETVVEINRISKKTKGGNQIRFSALVVVGDKKGRVGVGLAKASDVRSAIRKAILFAKRRLVNITLRGTTIPYSIREKFSAAKILIKPAPPGSGIIAGGPVRVVLEAVGIRDASAKILGTKNKISNVYATLKALTSISAIDKRKKEAKNKNA